MSQQCAVWPGLKSWPSLFGRLLQLPTAYTFLPINVTQSKPWHQQPLVAQSHLPSCTQSSSSSLCRRSSLSLLNTCRPPPAAVQRPLAAQQTLVAQKPLAVQQPHATQYPLAIQQPHLPYTSKSYRLAATRRTAGICLNVATRSTTRCQAAIRQPAATCNPLATCHR